MPQHSMQISKQSEDSQQASMMPQSMSQGQLQSSPISSPQQQQQASEVQMPHEACPRTMLQRVRNSQNKHARIQWTQQSSFPGQRGPHSERKKRHEIHGLSRDWVKSGPSYNSNDTQPYYTPVVDCELDVQQEAQVQFSMSYHSMEKLD